jgi:hypothetical protein
MAAAVVTEIRDGQDYDIGGLDGGSVLTWMGTIVGMSAYATGGVTFASLIADLDGATILHVMSGVGKDWTWRLLAGKLAAYVASTGAEVANGVDISTSGAIPVVIYYRKA